MVEFNVFVKRFAELPKFLETKGPELLMKHESEIVKLNKEQLMKGKNRLGETMQKGYSTIYGKKRKKSGLQTSFVDLKFTGAFQDGLRGAKQKQGIDILSDQPYGHYLRANFPRHAGLDKGNSDEVKKLLAEEVAVLIKKFLVK